ncbi:alkaline phosphatase family protein [Sphingorhabdus soli]|uniref:Alkaline phosphatase family protein n=1 Tax=Flavisphingopyxis soli TaxID=2601267 RepID=A0A5C6U7L2_9SPHN|nr:ectonucleotide pyrophosphatase/phosphodiesterase [Sphingorhabdus soli]TXC68839.1 alkaline phosphatase family protein [Sphingorhabdus soli]
MTRLVHGAIAAFALPFALAACVATPAATTVTSAAAPQPAEVRAPVTILISIDGFRPDYLRRGNSPNLDTLAEQGSETQLRPAFPTLTFPNHEALITGREPDHSGIVANTMYDPAIPDQRFYNKDPVSPRDPRWWQGAEPLWVTVQKAGVRAGTVLWPGSESERQGLRPSDWLHFDPAFDSETRLRFALDWIRRPAESRDSLVVVYLDAVDRASHANGITAPETADAVRSVDAAIGDLHSALAAMGQPANLVIVSDHGMAQVDPDRTNDLDTLLPRASYRLASYGPFATIDPVAGHEAEVRTALLRPHRDMQCWPRDAVPTRYRYGRNPRVAAIICLASHGGEVMPGRPTNKGDHGFDPDDPDMAALFIAAGPGIAKAKLAKRYDIVEVYPLVARLVGVAPLASDATGALADAVIAK